MTWTVICHRCLCWQRSLSIHSVLQHRIQQCINSIFIAYRPSAYDPIYAVTVYFPTIFMECIQVRCRLFANGNDKPSCGQTDECSLVALFDTLRPEQNAPSCIRHFEVPFLVRKTLDFEKIFNEVSSQWDNKSALVQIWLRPGNLTLPWGMKKKNSNIIDW